jgi:hypothetical protein
MFVRFRTTARRLQVSLAAARWTGDKPRQEHIASLGSVPLLPSAADRIAFWTRLHQRLDALSNRVDAVQRGAVLAAIHARIPMPTPDDQQAVQLEHAQADAKFWENIEGLHADRADGHKHLAASAQKAIAASEQAGADAAEKLKAARERLTRVQNGEAVPLPSPMTRKDMLRISGMTEAEVRHCVRVAEIAKHGAFERLLDEQRQAKQRAEKAVVRKLHRTL